MHELVDKLNEIAFTLSGVPTTWAEIFGFITGLATVALAARKRIENFPVGILNAMCFLILFWNARLFADATLQMIFIVLGVQGWAFWARGEQSMAERPMVRASGRQLGLVALGVISIGLILWPILVHAGDSSPKLDALTTAMSLGAQLLLNLGKLETWYLWIAVDLIYIPLYLSRDLYLTAIVYGVFLCICLSAVVSWRRSPLSPGPPVPEPA